MSNLTISLTGSEVKADFYGTNAWLRNDGTSTVYASKSPSVTAGADGVVSVPAGGSAPVFDAHGTVYLIGTGSVLLIGSDYSENPFKSSAQSGGSGADEVARAAIEAHAGNTSVHLTAEQLNNAVDEVKAYADEKDDETLAAAKTYADGLAMSGGGVAQTYVDEKDAETLSAAQSYADSAAQSAVTSAKAYTEQYSAKAVHTHTVSDITDFPEALPADGGNADTVNGLTVQTAVPANAKFTDTVYTHPSYTARSGVPTANQTPAFGGTFSVTQPVSDNSGHITAMNSRNVTIPSTPASTSAAGLVTTGAQTLAGDKTYNGKIIPNGASDVATAQARKISAGTDDLTAGTSELETGTIYLVYE